MRSDRELVELYLFKKVLAALFFLQFFRSDLLYLQFSGNKNLFRIISENFAGSRETIPDLLASDALEQRLFVREVWVPGRLGWYGVVWGCCGSLSLSKHEVSIVMRLLKEPLWAHSAFFLI